MYRLSMINQQKLKLMEKVNLHPLNPHRYGYDFHKLIKSSPALSGFVHINRFGKETIDYSDPGAVKALNEALLKHYYAITWWDIPEGCLCPPIPGRADYIHTMADLLTPEDGKIPTGAGIFILDIGVGANCVYPIIGRHEYGWSFVGTDINPRFLESAGKIVRANDLLTGNVELRLQQDAHFIFRGVVKPGDLFDLVICNPPFHSSEEEACKSTTRKQRNLSGKNKRSPVLNFGGGNSELWCEGGEKGFVSRMVKESAAFGGQCLWFSTLVSKKDNLPGIIRALKNNKALDIRIFDLAQGQKVSRVAAWTFLTPGGRAELIGRKRL